MFCTGVIRVSRSATQESEGEKVIRDICGPSSPDAFAFYDPGSSSLRTCQGTFPSDSMLCSVILPKRGSMRNGWLHERPTLVRHTVEQDFSSLPTPRATRGGSQSETAALLPTPNTMDAMNPRSDEALARAKQAGGCSNLKDVLPRLLPTPVASDDKGTTMVDRERSGPALRDVRHLLPTYRANATRTSRKSMVENQQWPAPSLEQAIELSQGVLPPEFKNWDEVPGWNGESTNQPSDSGNQHSGDKPRDQLTIEDA